MVAIIIQPPTNTTVTSGEDVNFTCTATGKPRPVINWLRNNYELKNNTLSDGGSPITIINIKYGNCTYTDPSRQCVLSSILYISNITAPDSGVYRCLAINAAGNDTKESNLIVNGKLSAWL